MSLRDHTFLTSYNKADHDIAEMFYLPSMRESIQYNRISGYFGSTIYIIAWEALQEFIEHGGKMRLVCSPFVSDEDATALSEGYSARTDEILTRSINEEVESLFGTLSLNAPARLLAYMVANGIIDVKIAVPTNDASPNARRLFHDKVGLFTDALGDSVGFRGSMNETFKGLSSDGNMESIDVFPSWLDSRDRDRVCDAATFFEKLWNYKVDGIKVYKFPDASREILRSKSDGLRWREVLDEVKVILGGAEKWKPNHSVNGKKPRPHQVNALEAWIKNGRRGIFEHATGSGKTFTAMCAINDALVRGDVVLILVPSRDLLTQWYRELSATLTDYSISYLRCGDGFSEWKKGNSLQAWTSKSAEKRIVLTTMDTACSSDFLSKVTQGAHLFIVADEVHRLGSPKRRNCFSLNTGARLGLSATPRRYGDEEGTRAIFEYFGGLIPPPFMLKDAINSGVLTKYFYTPIPIKLTQGEQEEWDAKTEEITRFIARLGGNEENRINFNAHPRLKQLILDRARIVKNASGKVDLAIGVLLKDFEAGQKWIVYCDNINQLKAVLFKARDAGFDAYEYYADMPGSREETLRYFSLNGGVLVSIKCLDEGVDIPSTTHALILASSQNPREFIQRRGRILRNSPGKVYARLYDAIAVPNVEEGEDVKSLSIIAGELSRAIQFGEGAVNPICVAKLKNIAIDYHIDFNELYENGLEEDEDNEQ